jgi:hypothetical protein
MLINKTDLKDCDYIYAVVLSASLQRFPHLFISLWCSIFEKLTVRQWPTIRRSGRVRRTSTSTFDDKLKRWNESIIGLCSLVFIYA